MYTLRMHDDGYFDERFASRYDEISSSMFDPAVLDPTVEFLAELSGGGKVLEFASGTGRVALPLSERGYSVSGVDISAAMTDRLKAKPGGENVDVTIGDFSSTRVEGEFSLVFLVFNTIMNLTSQDAQVACFQNAAEHLISGGHFVIEVSVPKLQRVPAGETYRTYRVEDSRMDFDEYSFADQGLISHHFMKVDDEWEKLSVPFRYVWPSELDLMARLAGLEIAGRWADWSREPFGDDSEKLIAAWRKA